MVVLEDGGKQLSPNMSKMTQVIRVFAATSITALGSFFLLELHKKECRANMCDIDETYQAYRNNSTGPSYERNDALWASEAKKEQLDWKESNVLKRIVFPPPGLDMDRLLFGKPDRTN